MAARRITATTNTVDEGSAIAGGVGTSSLLLIAFEDTTPLADLMAAVDRATELAIKDWSDQEGI